jgi:hypothetical protein
LYKTDNIQKKQLMKKKQACVLLVSLIHLTSDTISKIQMFPFVFWAFTAEDFTMQREKLGSSK